MKFECMQCGGNMLYSLEARKMVCPNCGGEDCYEINKSESTTMLCPSCGTPIETGEFTSATKCKSCGNYLILDERVEGDKKPNMIIPFRIWKRSAGKILEQAFKKNIFTPMSFLSTKTLEKIEGYYVPFFLYDYDVKSTFVADATKVRTWRTGDYRYTETSYYEVVRKMSASYDNVPADASEGMPDDVMDLIEPYSYSGLMDFDPMYLSGFLGEVYNKPAEAYENRANDKVKESSYSLIQESIQGFSTVRKKEYTNDIKNKNTDFALLPVWIYDYSWGGKVYRFYVNGQSGKVVGTAPVSKLKVLLYTLVSGGFVYLGVKLLCAILEVGL